MTPPTIKQLRTLRDEVRSAAKSVDLAVFKDEHYGHEDEYDARGVVSGAQALATDVATLTKGPKTFLQNSSHAERERLVDSFESLRDALTSGQMQRAAEHIDALQRALTRCGQTEERLSKTQEECSNRLETIQQRQSDLAAHEETVQRQQDEAETALTTAQKTREKIDSVAEEVNTAHQNVTELLTEAKSHEEVVERFSQRVSDREKQLDTQQSETDAFNSRLNTIEKTHEQLQGDAEELIASARTALQYKTAEGLNEAFQEKYLEAKRPALRAGWITGAGLFTVSAIGIGIWIFVTGNETLQSVLGRLALIPVLMAGAWFCASQFVKQKNITEDYAYKSVLTKSLVGFADQLSTNTDKGREYSDYIRTVLAEIHRDPLRKRREPKSGNPAENHSYIVDEVIKKLRDRLDAEQSSK